MTINSCLTLVDQLLPNKVERAVKCRWLEEVDAQVRVELWGEVPNALPEPTGTVDGSRTLSAPYPFDRLYWLYLVAMIHCVMGDTARYENNAALFNSAYLHYAKYVMRSGERGQVDA